MRVLLIPAMLLGVAACSPMGVPGSNVDLTPPAFAERPPPAVPPNMATAAPPPAAAAPAMAAGEPVPLTPAPGAAPSAELSIPGRLGPLPPRASSTGAQLPPPPPEIASSSPPAPAPAPPPPPPPPVAVAPPPPPPVALMPQPVETAVAPPPPPPEAVAAAAPPPPASVIAWPFTWPFFVSNQPVPGLLPGPRLTLSNYSYDRAHVEMAVTANSDCGAPDAVSRVEFDLAYNGTRVIQPPVGDDVCWRRDTSADGTGGAQWSRWNRAFLSAGQSVDSRL